MKQTGSARLYLALVIPLLLGFAKVSGQGRYLDTTFNRTGIRTVPVSPYGTAQANAITLDSASNVVVAGAAYIDTWRFGLTRLRPDGSLDTSLQHSGMLTTPARNGGEMAQAIAIGPGGRITLAGWYFDDSMQNHFAIMRYLHDGSPDAGFGDRGAVYYDRIVGTAYAVLLQPDGKTVVVGTGRDLREDPAGFMVLRLMADGGVDTSFGEGGIAQTRFPGLWRATAALLLGDGGILVGGVGGGGDLSAFMLVRFTREGVIDSAFGHNGVAEIPLKAGPATVASLLRRDDGAVVVVGSVGRAPKYTPALACVQADGSPDRNFGRGGIAVDTAAGPRMFAAGAAVLRDGRIAVGGSADDSLHTNFAIVRYAANGIQDKTLNGNGLLMSKVGSSYSYINGLIVQPDDKVVAAGWSWGYPASNEFAVARYQLTPPTGIAAGEASRPALHIYPNPSAGSVWIDIADGSRVGYTYRVYDAAGRQQLSGQLAGMRTRLDVRGLPAGTYVLKLSSRHGEQTGVFLKE